MEAPLVRVSAQSETVALARYYAKDPSGESRLTLLLAWKKELGALRPSEANVCVACGHLRMVHKLTGTIDGESNLHCSVCDYTCWMIVDTMEIPWPEFQQSLNGQRWQRI
jgi:hypothetical protein